MLLKVAVGHIKNLLDYRPLGSNAETLSSTPEVGPKGDFGIWGIAPHSKDLLCVSRFGMFIDQGSSNSLVDLFSSLALEKALSRLGVYGKQKGVKSSRNNLKNRHCGVSN